MGRPRLGKILVSCLSAFFALCGAAAMAGEPTETVKSTVDRVVQILTDPAYKGEANKEERRKLLRQTLSPRFDFAEMARRSLGVEWSRRTPEEQDEFVKLFTAFLERTSVQNIESYNNERFVYTGEKISSGHAEVEGKIVSPGEDDVRIDYLLDRAAGEWKVYDLVIDGISFDGNFRSQFSRLIRQSSYEGLLQRLKEKLGDAKFAAGAAR